MTTLHLGAAAFFAALARLTLIHRTILAGGFAIWFVRCKRDRAHRCDQDREQDFRVIFHTSGIVTVALWCEQKNEGLPAPNENV